jgi:hypothetical protein
MAAVLQAVQQAEFKRRVMGVGSMQLTFHMHSGSKRGNLLGSGNWTELWIKTLIQILAA